MAVPMARTHKESATHTAIVESGVTVTAIVAVGTRTPPIPKAATMPIPYVNAGVLGVTAARAPVKHAAV